MSDEGKFWARIWLLGCVAFIVMCICITIGTKMSNDVYFTFATRCVESGGTYIYVGDSKPLCLNPTMKE